MDIILYIIILIFIVSLILFLYVANYNKIQHYKTRIDLAENEIDESLRKKYDIICEINSELKKSLPKKDYLKKYINLKDEKITNFDTDRSLVECVRLINELLDEVKKEDKETAEKKLKEIKKVDEKLTASKNFYNKNTTELNDIIRIFPTNIIAKIHKYKIKAYFDNKNMHDSILDDFKL